MYSKDYGTTARRQVNPRARTGTPRRSRAAFDNEYRRITEAYADQFFDFLEPLKADRNFRDLVERNQHLSSRMDTRVHQLKAALALVDSKKVCQAAQELFDTVGRIGDVPIMRICYRILMQARSGNLSDAGKYVEDLESEYVRLQEEVLGFQVH